MAGNVAGQLDAADELGSGGTFTAVANHFKSKGSTSPFGDNAGIGDGAGNNNEARLQAAVALDAWLDTDPTGSGDEDFLILGDLNSYAQEDPIQYLIDEGYSDTVSQFLPAGEFPYSFGFPVDLDLASQTQAFGALDYALANSSLLEQVSGAAEWHINADEAGVFDYNTNFRPEEKIDGLYAVNPFRSSDHAPLIVGLDLTVSVLEGDSNRLDEEEFLSFSLIEAGGLGDATAVGIDFAGVRGSGEVALRFFDEGVEVATAQLAIINDRVDFALDGGQFDELQVQALVELQVQIAGVDLTRLDVDAPLVM